MSLLYNLGIELYGSAVKIASGFNPKAKQWIKGRADWRKNLKNSIIPGSDYVWIHCASLGEFEQGRPLIEALKKSYPNYKILLSFFSPSGFEVRKNYAVADHVCYLPLDTSQNASDFIEIVNPKLVVFVKYEFWLNYILKLNDRKIPLLIISCIFRPSQVFFKPYGHFFRKALRSIDHFFLQNQESANLLKKININHFTLSGDTRFDRVLEIAEKFTPVATIEEFIDDEKTIVAGSTWEEDEHLLSDLMADMPLKLIIAPHEIFEDRLLFLEKLFKDANPIRLSKFKKSESDYSKVLIIDNIGLLSRLYYYGFACFIGGGFGKGIHNTLEAAVYGKPLFFGPNYEKFKEAKDLVVYSAAFAVPDKSIMQHLLIKFLSDEAYYDQVCFISSDYVKTNAGATNGILKYIEEKGLL